MALICAFVVASCAGTRRFDGPLSVRNQHPAQSVVMQLEPDGARAVPADQTRLRMDLAYTSLFLAGSGNGNSFRMDGETARFAWKALYGLGGGVEVGIEFPIGHASGGFLDDFVIDWHDTFGFPDQGRTNAPRDGFDVVARRGGREVYRLDEERGTLLDIPIHVGWTPLPITAERPFGVKLRAGFELPTGNEDRGWSSGGIDTAFGISTEAEFGDFAWHAHVAHTWTETPAPARRDGFRFRDVTRAGTGIEWALFDSASVLVQAEWETSTLRGLGFDRVADPQLLLWTGVRWRWHPRIAFEVALGEDLLADVSPDFSTYFSIVMDLGWTKPKR